VTPEHANQSIPGAVHRLLTFEPSDFDYDEDGQVVPKAYRNLADIGPANAKWVIRGCQAAWVLAVVLLCRAAVTDPARRRGVWLAAEFALVVLGMLLFSERTWKHHGVTLMVPFATLLAFLTARPAGAGVRGFVAAAVVAAGALILVTSALPRDEQNTALTYGTHTAAFLVLTAASCAVMWSERARAAPAGVPSGE
jgi:alpha-1,2-mannosyltransferase